MIVSDVQQARPRNGAVLRRVLAHRRLTLVVPAGLGLGIAFAGYAVTPATYNSEAVVVLDARKIQALPTESVVSPLPQESPVLRSELDIIASHTMAERVLRRLSPEAVELIRNGKPGWSLRRFAGSLLATSSAAATADPPLTVDTEPLQGTLLSSLRVSNDGRSYTIFISYSAGDPDVAADVANAFAESYLDYQVDVQGAGTRQVSDWLGQKLVTMRTSLENSEQALNEFRGSANLQDDSNLSSHKRRVEEAEAEYAAGRAALAASQARLAIATRQLKDSGELALPELVNNLLIQNLKTEQYRIERRIREIADGGATMSAELPGLKSQLTVVQQQIDSTTKQVIETLTADVDVAKGRMTSAEQALGTAREELGKASNARVHEAQLEREAAANGTIYESYLGRYKQTIEQEGIASPDARIISRAEVSKGKTGPRLQNWLVTGLALGGLFGLGIAFVREGTDRRIRSAATLAEQTGQPVLGAIPNIPPRNRLASKSDPRSTEAAIALCAAVRRVQSADDIRVIALTSPRVGDGKTTVAVSLARAMASGGAKVLIVDCNLMRPALAGHFSLDKSVRSKLGGSQKDSLNAPISIDGDTGISVVAGDSWPTMLRTLIAGKGFREQLANLRKSFDTVILDGPALSQSPDAWQVTALADRVVLVVNKATSSIADTKAAIDRLQDYDCDVMGIVIDRHVDRAAFPHSSAVEQTRRASRDTYDPPGAQPA